MDRQLGKLASASVRRQRIQERQKHKDLMMEQREERKQRMRRYNEIYNADSTSASDDSRSNSPEHDSAADTPSDCSISTPDHSLSPDVAIKPPPLDLTTKRFAARDNHTSLTEKEPAKMDSGLDRRSSKTKSEKPAMLGASLNRLCDFRYDRFSTVFESIDLDLPEESDEEEKGDAGKADSSASSDDDDDDEDDEDEEDYSPIEVATPIAIRMPVSRPAMISVVSSSGQEQGLQKFSVKNISNLMINPPSKPSTPQARSEQSLDSRPQTSSSFLTSTSKPMEAITPSSASIVSVAPSSTKSLPPMDQSSVDSNLKKKSSMPMLHKFTHSRMHSFKNMIKTQSISGPPPAVPMIPSAHQPRPSESANQILLTPSHQSKPSLLSNERPSEPRRSMTDPNFPREITREIRPQTARAPSQISVTALPTPPPVPSPKAPAHSNTQISMDEAEPPSMNRKKSFSNLRRRSGSLGQALKFSSGKNKSPAPEAPLPPLPTINLPTRTSIDATHFPTPPRTPKNVRKSGLHMYSAFPTPSQSGEPVGLGLRM